MTFNVEKDLRFILSEKKAKTQVYRVLNKQQACYIGTIKWHPSWRHYVFSPEENTIYSDRCLIKIGEFILELNQEYRDRMKEGKNVKMEHRQDIRRT